MAQKHTGSGDIINKTNFILWRRNDIETNRLLDFASEFLCTAKEKADRHLKVKDVKDLYYTKPPFDYQTYYGGKTIKGRTSVFGYVFPREEEVVQALERE